MGFRPGIATASTSASASCSRPRMPVARLSVTNVATLPAVAGRRTDYVDALLPGFVLRVTPRGARTYAVAAWDGGRKRRITLGGVERLPLGAARARAREVLEAIARREEPPAAPTQPSPLTVARLVDRCLAALELRPATRREWERIARTEIVPAFGARRAGGPRGAGVPGGPGGGGARARG